MNGRIKFQVWSPVQGRWRTAYVRDWDDLMHNAKLFGVYGFRVRP